MRLLLVLVVCLACAPLALAEGQPSPAVVAACQAEASQLGKDAFVAKYGPNEPWGHCYAAKAATATPPVTTTTTPAPPADPAVAACKAEYLKIGGPAFLAKYGTKEMLGHCVAAQHSPEKAAQAACLAEAKSLGTPAFAAKYGAKEPFGTCVKLALKKNRR